MPVLAQADTGNIVESQEEPLEKENGFQAGTCTENSEEEDPAKEFCSAETPGLFFTQAGGHPPIGFTQYIVRHDVVGPTPFGTLEPIEEPIANRTIKTLRVDLPPGLTVNPQATEKCSRAAFETKVETEPGKFAQVPNCPDGSIVGEEEVWLVVNTAGAVPAPPPAPPGTFLPKGFVIKPNPAQGTKVPVYNIEPEPGEPARFGFVIAFQRVVFLETEVAWENDFHESFTIRLPEPSVPFSTLKSRLVNFGQEAGNQKTGTAGDGTYITNPTTCFDPDQLPTLYSTWFRAESWGEPNATFPAGSTPWEAKLPEGMQATGCDLVPFDPTVEVNPGTSAVDSPAPVTVTTRLPFDPAKEGGEVRNGGTEGISQSHVRKAEVQMPAGMGLNPAGAQGLVACTDAQFNKGERTYTNECPAESKIGTVEVDSPPLAELLTGDVYVGEQKSSDPESGDLYRILIEAKNENEGIAARLVGRVKANKTTGQLTAEIYDDLQGQFTDQPVGLPQVPFEEIRLHLKGSKDVLSSPPICSTEGESTFEPWARPDTNVKTKSKVTLSSDPGGGACPATMAERKFAPSYTARTNSTKARAYSPFRVRIGRTDGQQELKVVDVTLPKGLTGKLAGIPYCPEPAIAAAIGKSGQAEKSNPSCSSDSYIGTVTTQSGTGSNPLQLSGIAYLAGPYKGAPLSMVTITPAVAGPFDLGTVVVRVALNVNPETAQIRAVSDVIPDVFGGAKLDIRLIDLNVDRGGFMLNPTNCKAQATAGTINGGGADPTNPAAFSSYAVSDPFQATQCNKLAFKPKLKIQLFGGTTRNKYPRLKATLTARKADANMARTAVTMPRSLFLEQGHIGTVCTRPQLAAHQCPKASVYGKAWAKSPLLSKKLAGKVYLVSSNNELPDLLVDLRGQVDIHLRGVISSGSTGGLKTVFRKVPDVPVSKFVLNMKGGKKSLLVNSQNTCAKPQRAIVKMKGQNGKKKNNNRQKLNIVSCGKKKKGKK
ncbi:MAG TPA: hypothetical protein VFT79_09285 [Solirubrobacterales bacterium]|nr:hypothetical protein [Solirubrobacterales bacterium]